MSDKIKIVYSWIGPRGPIWNTELPNVLSFSAVSEGTQSTSHRFWTDDLWRTIFQHADDQFEIYPACGIDVKDDRPFIFPMSLAWRISFENYFVGDTGIMEFAHMPGHLIQLLREGNGYLLIDHSVEAFMSHGYLNAMHGYFQGVHGIPLHKIIYLTGCINSKAIYDEYCLVKGIPDDKYNRLTIVSYPSSQNIFKPNVERTEDEPIYNTEYVPDKLFLMWNRRYRPHRIAFSLFLEDHGLIERSLISFSDVEIERPTIKFKDAANVYNLQMLYTGTTQELIDRFASKLPLVIDGETNINQMCEDRGNVSRSYYQNTLVSIITETNFTQNEVTLTEKSYKPIKEKHPFIILGVNGALQGMRDAGFKTFSDFWDESYDTIQDPRLRLEAAMQIVKDISTWDDNKIREFKRNVKPILDYNFNLLKDSSPRNIALTLSNIVRNTHG